MSFNETTARHIQYDFDVKLLAKTGRTALFGALREGGLGLIMWSDIINVAQSLGAWQFVAIATDVDDPNGLHFEQWHIPRYAMAQALKQNEPTLQTAARSEAVQLHGMPLPTWLREDHSLAFHLDKFGEFVLPDSLVEQMKNDLPLLESAQAQVQPRDGKFYLPDWSTPRNHAVESPSRDLLTAIAFEKLTVPKMKAKNFGIFSAYCSFRDFNYDVEAPEQLIRDFVEVQGKFAGPEDTSDYVKDIYAKVQERLFSVSVWGTGITLSVEEAIPHYREAVSKLTRTQRTQLALMNGMHGTSPLMALAVILGIVSFARYADAAGLNPGTPEDLEVHIQSAYLKLFGELSPE